MTLAADARAIARAGIRAVAPEIAVRRELTRRGRRLTVAGRPMPVGPSEQVSLLAVGKAAPRLADAAYRVLGRGTRGLVVAPESAAAPLAPFELVRGGHPVPDRGSVAAARAALRFLDEAPPGPVLFLISGGGSAILEAPVEEVPLSDLRRATSVLLASGAPIQVLNALRRHLSRVKGGRLGVAAAGHPAATLAISDVVGDRPEDIASGPTVPDPSTFRQAEAGAHRFGLWEALPASVRTHLAEGRRGRRAETPKPGDPRLAAGRFHLIATNRTALEGAAAEARRRGYPPFLLSSRIVGEATEVAGVHAAILREIREHAQPVPPPACLLSGGETTVTLGPHPGRGGRNQEFALRAALDLDGLTGVVALSAGTDGIDGPTDAAGGWADGMTADRARRRGLSLDSALRAHASYEFLAAVGSLWKTGPTGTNVSDLRVLLAGPGRPPVTSDTERSTPPRADPTSRRRRS
ncbi:MAG: glycerate kinase type-2 family protein [Thermoplasmata archaeon]